MMPSNTASRRRFARPLIAVLAALGGLRTTPVHAATDALSPDSLRAMVTYLAANAREGRGPGTRGLDQAADFIAAHFKAAGLEPAGDQDTYFQGFEVTTGVRPSRRMSRCCISSPARTPTITNPVTMRRF